MPLTREGSAQVVRRLALVAVIAVLLLMSSALASWFSDAWAQAGPFGDIRGQQASGFAGWLLAKQATFYRALAGLIRAAKTDGSAYWGLMGISFVYGIFHAAGPGHGKAVISSYLLANEETWRRGIVLSFASALLQAVTAVAIVTIAAVMIGATAKMMGDTVRVIEVVSYALIVLVGLRLLWVKGRGFLRAVHDIGPKSEAALAAPAVQTAPDHLHDVGVGRDQCRHDHHASDEHSHHGHDHAHDHAHGTRIGTRMSTQTKAVHCRGAMRMDPNRRNWPGRAAGGAGSRRSSPSGCGPARGRSSFSSSPWRRACSGPASPRLS